MRKTQFNMKVCYRDKPDSIIPGIGYLFDYSGFQFIAHRPYNFHASKWEVDGFEVSEYSTGMYVAKHCKTQREAIAKAKGTIDRIGIDATSKAIANFPKLN